MARPFALGAKVVLGFYQASAEKHRPITVHGYTGGEGVLLRDQPAAESKPVDRPFGQRRKDRGCTGRDLLPFVAEVASNELEGFSWRVHFLHDQRRGDLFVEL